MSRLTMPSLPAAWRCVSGAYAVAGALMLALLSALLLTSCSYRMAGVKPLGEPIRVEITTNKSRLVRVQGYLQEAVAAAIENRLGWRVSPAGSAKIELFIDEEVIDARGTDSRGIATRWTITCRGKALFTSRHGNATTPWTGTGYSAGLNDEADALENAALNAASLLATWLENQAEQWPAPKE
jgi:hypothetical protein